MSDDFSSPKPFTISIPDADVQRMVRLVADTSLPTTPPIPGASWDYGIDLTWLTQLRQAWLDDFDWKDVEREMNTYAQYTVLIESVSVHFVHVRSARPDATPIILIHGWPGSFWEYHRMVALLTDPPPSSPAFHVVIPSLPGFGFSSAPPRAGWTMADNACIFDKLMTGVLGYATYMAAGGDYGGFVCLFLGTDAYPACRLLDLLEVPAQPTWGALLTLPLFLLPARWRDWAFGKIYDEDERKDFARNAHFLKTGLGYFIQQATRPLTIGYALHDSPVGLLAWIGEKYREHVDPAILPTPECTRFVLTTVSLYFLTGTFMTSALPYRENAEFFTKRLSVTKPYGASRFAHDILHVPFAWVKKQHPNAVFVRRHERGGHFPGFEVPELLAGDLQEMVSAHKRLFV